MLHLSLILFLLLPQGPFDVARPGRVLHFPEDHGSHPSFRTEWWYFTGHLTGPRGRRFGFEVTFFRIALQDVPENPSSWRPLQLYPAHFAISDLENHRFHFEEKVAREGAGLAGAKEGTLEVRAQNWHARLEGETFLVRAAVPGMKLDLRLQSRKPPVLHGEGGFSRKGPAADQASHYYSMTRLEGAGELQLGEELHTGQVSAWMDHEFMSNVLSEGETGWDWFSLQLDNGDDLMLFQVRRRGGEAPFASGTWVSASGRPEALPGREIRLQPLEYWRSPDSGADYPIAWNVSLPSRGLLLQIRAAMPNQELITLRSTGVAYWEGSVEATGTLDGARVQGRGYLEMTGYSGERPRI